MLPSGRFPFHKDDLRYHHAVSDIRNESNAVVLCIMDTSGSMDRVKKYLARSFFFPALSIHQHALSKRRDRFHRAPHRSLRSHRRGVLSQGRIRRHVHLIGLLSKALEIIAQRYHPALWNVYAFHCSDGDNFDSDNPAALKAAEELTKTANLFGYGEIKPLGSGYYGSSMIQFFSQIQAANFQTVQIQKKEDIWTSVQDLSEQGPSPRGRRLTQFP
jgi:uncharacterized sporulation protein YeaH/YhbH (DUF444 family)